MPTMRKASRYGESRVEVHEGIAKKKHRCTNDEVLICGLGAFWLRPPCKREAWSYLDNSKSSLYGPVTNHKKRRMRRYLLCGWTQSTRLSPEPPRRLIFHYFTCCEGVERCLINKDVLFKRILASLSQKLTVPSAPDVEKVPCTGWKLMSFTEYTRDSLFCTGPCSVRWHLKE